MTRARLAIPAFALACLAPTLSACESAPEAGPDKTEKRDVGLECMTEQRGVRAHAVGDDEIQVGEEGSGPRVKFFITSGDAESRQFQGGAEGTEQLGNALLYVNDASDEVLDDVEFCLSNL
jgi:hypothetical protein